MNFAAKTAHFGRADIATVLIGALGFFVGRAVVFDFVNPLAVPFLAAFAGGKGFYVTAAFVALGVATRLGDFLMARYLVAVALLCTYYFFGSRLGKLGMYWVAGAAAAASLIAGAAAAAMFGWDMFLLSVALIEMVLAAGLTLVLRRAHIILTGRRRHRAKLLSGEDIASVTIVLSGIIAGASDIYVGAVPLRIFFCVYVLAVVAWKGGPGMAAGAGVIMGFLLHLAGYWDAGWAAVLAVAGMGGGFASRYGRVAMLGGLAAAGAAALFFTDSYYLGFNMLYGILAAGLAFMLTPQGFYFNVASAINPVMDSADDYMDKIKEETTRRLDAFAGAFGKLADTFSGLSKPKTALDKHDVAQLIDEVAARACGACERAGHCWEDDLYNTHQQVFALLAACQEHGSAKPEHMSDTFRASCAAPARLASELNAVYAAYRTDLRWHNRITESRELISQQLHGVAGIVQTLSREIDMSLRFHEGLEEQMIFELLKQKIESHSVIIMEDNAKRLRCSITLNTCNGKRMCERDVLPVLSTVLKRKMRVEGTGCHTRGGHCYCRFIEDQRLRVTTGVACRAKSTRGSGDSYSAMELPGGSCLMVLSDGMGSGERARRESTATVGLLEDFIESGFDKELAVRMINSVLVLKSAEESFSTLDIASVDLYTGRAEFIKIGAAATYILRDGALMTIRSRSLPIGMLNDIDFESTEMTLRHNDYIIMITDGIEEDWIPPALENSRPGSPQDLADHIMRHAELHMGPTPKDDMTILAARVWEKG
jgi:stage II sporulation protein E